MGKTYSSTMMTVSTLTSLVSNSYLSTQQFADFEQRVVRGVLLNVVVFAILAFVEMVDPQLNSLGYFIGIMALVLVSSVGTSIQQNGSLALANVKGPEYAQAVMVGQAIAGVLPSLSLVISELFYIGENERGSTSIVLYFATTSVITMGAGILFHITHRFEDPKVIMDEETTENHEYVPFMTLFRELQYIVISIVVSFLVSLVFPIFASNTTTVHKDWRLFDDAIFIPMAFLTWNLGDLSGRVLCGYAPFVITSDTHVFVYSLARFIFLPLLLMCNIDSRPHPWIPSDALYLLFQFLFGLTNGHCLSCCFMAVPSYVAESQREAAGGFTTVFLSLGLLLGSVFSFLFVPLVG
jgi:equilibrative nucleoside transporter 1/2/3